MVNSAHNYSPFSYPQFNMQRGILSSIRNGTRIEKLPFSEVEGYHSEVSKQGGNIIVHMIIHLNCCW